MTALGRNEIKLSFRSSLVKIIYELDGILLIKVIISDIQTGASRICVFSFVPFIY
jgi:hypothetical protein